MTLMLSVIIPAYNEGETLTVILKRIMDVPVEKEVIIVDDGSSDDTPRILDAYKNRRDITIIRHETNRGKGMAVRSAIAHITGDITIIQDADLEYDPVDYLILIEPIEKGEARVVYGARLGPHHSYYRYYIGGRILSLIFNILYHQNITDLHTGYKVFDSGLLKSIPLTCLGFEFCPEVTARIAKRGIRIGEIPIHYYPRTFKEGKKIRWTDGAKAFWIILKLRFTD